MKMTIAVMTFSLCAIAIADEPLTSTYGSLVDDTGNISLPGNFRSSWTFLGTWSIAEKDVEPSSAASGHGAAGLHNVYTQPGVAEYFRQHGKFSDGAVIIKELLIAATASMTTGTVSRGDEVEGWFVMVKDTNGRFGSNPLWGDGWGWALLNADRPNIAVTRNYKTECVGCHIPGPQRRLDLLIGLSGVDRLMHSQPLPINVVGRQDLVPVADFGETMGNFIHLLSSGLMLHVAFSQITRVEPSIVLGDDLVALYNLEAIASKGASCA